MPLALLSVAASAFVSVAIFRPQYQSVGTLLVTAPPAAPFDQNGRPDNAANPYNNFGGPLAVVTDLLARVFSTDSKAATLKDKGLPGTFTVVSTTDGPSPLLTVTGTARVGADAEATVATVLASLQADLVDRQAATLAPTSSFVHSQVLTAPSPARRQYGSVVRAAAAALAAGAVLTLAVTFLADAMIRRRSPRRSRQTASDHAAAGRATVQPAHPGARQLDVLDAVMGTPRRTGTGLGTPPDRYARRG